MTLISATAHVPFPRDLVYATYRDHLVELVSYLPNVRGIEVKSRTQQGGLIHMVNEWHGGGDIPLIARTFLNEAMLSWTDLATWNESEYKSQWQIHTHVFTEAVDCGGTHYFREAQDGTLIESRGELVIKPDHLKGIPHLVVGKVGQIVEDYLSQRVTPNLLQVSEGVRQYLEEADKRSAL